MHLIEKGIYPDFDELMLRKKCQDVEKITRVYWLVSDEIADSINMNIIFDDGSTGLDKIASLVCMATGVDKDELGSEGSYRELSQARHIITFFYFEHIGTDKQPLMDLFNRTDASIIYMKKQSRGLKKYSSEKIKGIVRKIERML